MSQAEPRAAAPSKATLVGRKQRHNAKRSHKILLAVPTVIQVSLWLPAVIVMTLAAALPDFLSGGLVELLKLGQFGAAVAMLLLGFYLYWRALTKPVEEIPARKGVAQQFMTFAILFFILCSIGEIVKFLLPGSHPQVK